MEAFNYYLEASNAGIPLDVVPFQQEIEMDEEAFDQWVKSEIAKGGIVERIKEEGEAPAPRRRKNQEIFDRIPEIIFNRLTDEIGQSGVTDLNQFLDQYWNNYIANLDPRALQEWNLQSATLFRSAYYDYAERLEGEVRRTQNVADVLKGDLRKLGEPDFTQQEKGIENLHFDILLDINATSLQAVFDQFQPNKFFQVIWIPDLRKEPEVHTRVSARTGRTTRESDEMDPFDFVNTTSLLKVYEGDGPIDLSWTEMAKGINQAYVRIELPDIGKDAIIKREEDGSWYFTIIFRRYYQANIFQNYLKYFPLPINLENALSKARYVTALSFNEDVVVSLDAITFAIRTHGLLARYLTIRERGRAPRATGIDLTYRFPFKPWREKPFNFTLMGNRPTVSELKILSYFTTGDVNEANIGRIELRYAQEDEETQDTVRTIGLLLQYFLSDVQQTALNFLATYNLLGGEELLRSETRTSLTKSALSAQSRRSTRTSQSINLEVSKGSAFDLNEFFIDPQNPLDETLKLFDVEPLPDDYGRSCSRARQPLILRDDKKRDWENLTFTFGGNTYNRLAIPYPSVNNPTVWLASPHPQFPFIGMTQQRKENYLPCSFNVDQETPGKPLEEYLRRGITHRERRLAQEPSKKLTALNFLSYGPLPSELNNLLAPFFPNENLYSMGMPRGGQSFFHALLFAIEDIEYMARFNANLEDKQVELNSYVAHLKEELVTTSGDRFELVRDTHPGQTLEEVKDLFLKDIYFDPLVWVRLLEEVNKIRILIVMSESGSKEPRLNKIYFPQIKSAISYPPISFNDRRELIIILGHAKGDIVQWQPVFWMPKKRTKTQFDWHSVFTSEEGKLLRLTIMREMVHYRASFNPTSERITLNDDWFNDRSLLRTIGLGADRQILTGLGQCRFIHFNGEFWLEVPNLAPLPIPEDKNVSVINEREPPADLDAKLKTLGKHVELILENNGKISRYRWKGLGYEIVYYMRGILEGSEEVDFGDPSPLDVHAQLSYLRRTARRLEYLMGYAFTLYSLEVGVETFKSPTENRDVINEFMKEEVALADGIVYDFSDLYGSYPVVDSFQGLKDALEGTGLSDGKFWLLPDEESWKALRLFLYRWVDNRLNWDPALLTFEDIPDFYRFDSDYKSYPETTIFQSQDPFIKANQLYLMNKRNLEPFEVIEGPFQYLSIKFPTKSLYEAVVRGYNWQTSRLNSYDLNRGEDFLTNLRLLIYGENNKIEKTLDLETEPAIYILEESRGKQRGSVYSVLLPIAET